jgi:signal transduction histidine kinase
MMRGSKRWSDRDPDERWKRFDARRIRYHDRAALGRAQFFRRLAIMAAFALVLAMTGITAVAWTVATRLGLPPWGGSVALMAIAVVAMLGMGRAFGAMRQVATPLAEVMEAADRVAGGDYDVRVNAQGPPPIRALAHSFNAMTGRLQDADRLRRDLMADLAHELRTPLTVLQGRIEGLIDGVYTRDADELQQLLDETRVLSRLIDDLRTLALSDAGGLRLEREPTDLGELVRDTLRSFQEGASARGVDLGADEPLAGVSLNVDPVRIREVLSNLLSNALRHTKTGGSVGVSVTQSGDRIATTVADTGSGMTDEDRARMFDRFFKGAESRGSGLGLAIAKSLVVAHGGAIAAASRPGQGTTVTFTLPTSQP